MEEKDKQNILEQTITRQAEEIEILRSVINSLPSSIYWKDKSGANRGANTAGVEKMKQHNLPWKSIDIIGKTDYSLFPEEIADRYRKNDLEVMSKNKEIFNEEVVELPNGKKLVQLSYKRPLTNKNGDIIGIVGNTIDITYLKKIEQELREAKVQAEKSLQTKNQFMRNIQHDIRTPFSGIIGLTELLLQNETNANKQSDLNDILHCSKELLEYCNQILLLSEIENNSIPIITKQFSLKSILSRINIIEKPPAKDKNLNLEISCDKDIPRSLIGDEYRLFTVLLNLVSNAIKFTHKGKISLTVNCLVNSEEETILRFKIKDTGIGIPNDKHDLIFEKFSRLSPSYKGIYSGIGLGLNIVREFVNDMKGSIKLISTPKNGSTFICDIPFLVSLPK